MISLISFQYILSFYVAENQREKNITLMCTGWNETNCQKASIRDKQEQNTSSACFSLFPPNNWHNKFLTVWKSFKIVFESPLKSRDLHAFNFSQRRNCKFYCFRNGFISSTFRLMILYCVVFRLMIWWYTVISIQKENTQSTRKRIS